MNGPLLTLDFAEVRSHWAWVLVPGIVLIFPGMIPLSPAVVVTVVSVMLLGFLLLIGGAMQFVEAFRAGRWGGFFLHVLAGILDVVLGLFLVARPAVSAVELTILLAAFLFVSGLFRIVFSAS